MKLYLLAPSLAANSDGQASRERIRACIEPIAELIAGHLEADPGLFALRHEGEVSDTEVPFEFTCGPVQVARIPDRRVLRNILTASGNPNSGRWMLVRSLVTCRAARYGSDGQAFLCLTASDSVPVSPDDSLFVVEECSQDLLQTDLMDGVYLD